MRWEAVRDPGGRAVNVYRRLREMPDGGAVYLAPEPAYGEPEKPRQYFEVNVAPCAEAPLYTSVPLEMAQAIAEAVR